MIQAIKDLKGKKVYFASDFHLGTPDKDSSLRREKKIVNWLSDISGDAAAIFLLGDIFDFWFEYKYTVPKGYIRLLGKLAELKDVGIPIYIFTGNHDMWMFDYFPKELGIPIFKNVTEVEISDKHFVIGHGDGLGPGDHFYKFLKKIFANKLCQFIFSMTPPWIGIGIANSWSKRSRISNTSKDENFLGEEEWLFQYCNARSEKENIDYFVFGHRHLPLDMKIGSKSRYINLGEWVNYDTYAVFDGSDLMLTSYSDK